MSSEENQDNAQFEKIEYTGESSESSSCDLTELVYKLDWTLRDEIILNLNGYSRLLCGKELGGAAKERLAQANADLYQQLINLPLKSHDEISDLRSSEVVLELAFGVKGEVVSALITNQSLIKACLKGNVGPRMRMIEKNNSLVATLMKLPVSVSDAAAEDVEGQMPKDELNGLTELSRLADESMNRTNENNGLRVDEQAKGISALGADLSKLKAKNDRDLSDLVRLTDGEEIIFLTKAKAEFECCFDDIAAFLKSGEKRKRQVAIFKNVVCSVEISKATEEKRDYLSVFVRIDDLGGTLPKEGYCKITLFNQRDSLKNQSFNSYFKFTDTDCLARQSMCCGEKHFISMKDLRYNHFIEDDQIKFRIHLDMPQFNRKLPNLFGLFLIALSILMLLMEFRYFKTSVCFGYKLGFIDHKS